MRSFADIPAEIVRRTADGERVALILLDALGLEQLERERDHPLHERLHITPIDGQFPSTTTAHVSTLAFGLPVEIHGLYEWRVLEPALDEVIVPLRFRRDISETGDELAGVLDPAVLVPGPTLYQQLGVDSAVLFNHERTRYSRVAQRGARPVAFTTLPDGLARLRAAFAEDPELGYAYLYWGEIDRLGHHHGPASAEYRAEARAALTAIHEAANALTRAGITVLITADHGQVDVHPDRVDRLDEVWPELTGLLTHRAAGSARDVFLHLTPGSTGRVVAELGQRLGERASVHPAIDLFPGAGPRLTARLADVAVLPADGRCAWLAATPSVETWNRGSHGGRTSAETSTYLAALIA